VPTREGFGGRIINQLVTQLNGSTHFDWRMEGLGCKINIQT
jgi:two-component sensor histidine kinase